MSSTAKVNIESKHHLARLLATENIWIQHQKVATASFDLVSRILTFPIWKDMEEWLYTMLAAHEVGHALYSERSKVSDIGKRIDPKNPYIAGAYWNVVEDARIERLIKETYPGLVHIFSRAYRDLFERNLFGTKNKDLESAPLLDRLNLYFKVGTHVNLNFTKQEQVFVDKMKKLLTGDDAVNVAKEIYEFSKHEHNQVTPIPQEILDALKKLNKDNPQCDDDPIFSEDGEPTDGDKDDESKPGKNNGKKGKGKPNEKKDKDKGKGKKDKDSGEDEGDGSSGGDADGDGNGEADGSDGDDHADGDIPGTGHKALKPVDPGPPPAPFTQTAYDEKIQDFNDPNAIPVQYVTLPKPNLKNILVGHEKVHANIRNHNFGGYDYYSALIAAISQEDHFQKAAESFEEFRRANKPKVDYIFQQFMMKKQADRYKRTKQHKTGSLDPLRMWAYKVDEDLFKSIAIVADDKNHGLIFVVDWSGSMSSSMVGTLEQLIILCMFCRKAKIPFLVYSLTTGGHHAFSKEPGTLVFAENFRMRCYLSSEMTPKKFSDACVNLFAMMNDNYFGGGPPEDNLIGCTPLNEAIIATIDLMEDFRQRTKAQVVNAIFMTDGQANTVSQFLDKSGHLQYMNSGTKYLIDDRKTHKVYDFDWKTMTPTMLTILRDRQDINVVGFYIGGSWQTFFTKIDAKTRAVLTKQFREDGFVIATEWGYNELYITKSGDRWRVKNVALEPKVEELGTEAYSDKLAENFTKQRRATLKQRVMLDRFVKMIA